MNVSYELQYIMFGDDVRFFLWLKFFEKVETRTNIELKLLIEWFQVNSWSLNCYIAIVFPARPRIESNIYNIMHLFSFHVGYLVWSHGCMGLFPTRLYCMVCSVAWHIHISYMNFVLNNKRIIYTSLKIVHLFAINRFEEKSEYRKIGWYVYWIG